MVVVRMVTSMVMLRSPSTVERLNAVSLAVVRVQVPIRLHFGHQEIMILMEPLTIKMLTAGLPVRFMVIPLLL